ncbi:MAG: hypothetical protein IH868_03235 [Chloroflexi bacterium]|nr:hypothetical protein [Chloroflexota bacterium]
MPDHPEPTVIPIPDEFPVTWDPPELINLPWKQDRQHAPEPITPMCGWLGTFPWATGATQGLQAAGQPLTFNVGRFNTQYYIAIVPSMPPEEMEAAGAQAEEVVKELLGTYEKRWDEEWLPKVKSELQAWAEFDLPAASDDQLLSHMDDSITRYTLFWDIHFHLAIPMLVGPSMFVDFYNDLFEGAEELEAYRLLQGIRNMSIVAGEAIWDLSQKYKDVPGIANPLRSKSASAALSGFVGTDEGREFLRELRELLDRYGHRSDGVLEVAHPSWTEDPSTVINMMKDYMDEDAQDPRETHARLASEREAAVAGARKKLESYPEPVRDQFEFLLAAALAGGRIQEDHNFWIDQQSLHFMRQMFLEFGRRLVDTGKLDAAADVMYLVPDQIRASLKNGEDFRSVVAREKEEMSKFGAFAPPPVIGTDYGPPPLNPVTAALGRFFGNPPQPPAADGTIIGTPVSSGVVTGTAKVVIRLTDAGKLNKGDILVAATTAPPWTPLFAIAGGIVTDTGGPLSHCGIVAREYGIPCVGGTGGATSMIKDGQTIEVNGDAGTVRIIS